jgi:hypothetical protein
MAPFHGLCTDDLSIASVDPGGFQHREGDERDFDQLDASKSPEAALPVAAGGAGAKADRQPVDRAIGDEARQIVG